MALVLGWRGAHRRFACFCCRAGSAVTEKSFARSRRLMPLLLKKLTLAPSSQRIERANLKHLRPKFERRLVTDIQAEDVNRYQQVRMAEGAAPKTINLEVGTLRAILRRHRVWRRYSKTFGCSPPSMTLGTPLLYSRKPHCLLLASRAV